MKGIINLFGVDFDIIDTASCESDDSCDYASSCDYDDECMCDREDY